MAATTALRQSPDQPLESRGRSWSRSPEEAHHPTALIDATVEIGRLDTTDIRLQTAQANVGDIVRDVVASMRTDIDGRPVQVTCDEHAPTIAVDERLVKLAIRQLGFRERDRMYGSPSVERRIPGSGLGLSIALNIVRAPHGDLTVTSRRGETTFRLTLPAGQKGARK